MNPQKPALLTLWAFALAAPAWSQSVVPILNPGFEAPAVATPGGFIATAEHWAKVNGGDSGVWRVAEADYPGLAPQGIQIGYVYGANVELGLSQILSGATGQLQADASYALSVRVGRSLTYDFPGYKVQLRADGIVLAEDDNTLAPTGGTFLTTTLNYTYNAGLHAALVGKPLEIRLLSKGLVLGEVDFDDVQLTATLPNPIANVGGPYNVVVTSGALALNASASLPSSGATITLYEWDLNNDNTFGDVTGATPAPISVADLQATWGMTLGANPIQLRITDSAAKTSTVSGLVSLTALPTPVAYWPMRGGAPGQTVPAIAGAIAEVIGNPSHPATNATPNNANSSWHADPLRGIVWKTVEGNRLNAGTQGIDLNNGFTWSLWVNVASSNITDPGADSIMGTRQGSPWHKIDLATIGNWNGNVPSSGSYPTLATGQWIHIGYVGDMTGRRLYVNGVSVGVSATTTAPTFNGALEIGGTSNFSEDITGLYSDVAIWNVRLTESQILELAAGANPTADSTAPVIAVSFPKDDDLEGATNSLRIIFDEPVVLGGGNIRIVNTTTDTTTVIAITDASQVTVSGASLTIVPTVDLVGGNDYAIEMDAGVVKNIAGLNFAGINDRTTWNFTADNLAPTVVSIGDEYGGTSFGENMPSLRYTVTFNEPIDGSSVSDVDFTNAGTATITIGTVTQIAPEVFTVQVLPTSTGTLQLSVPSGSVILDASGNALNTSSAILDDTVITITSGITPGVTITGTAGGGDSWNGAANWSGGFVPKSVWPAIIADGVLAQVSNAFTLTYSGGLTIGAGATLRIANTASSENAIGTGTITFAGGTLDIQRGININFPPVVLAGDGTFASSSNQGDNRNFNMATGITGTGDLKIIGRNQTNWNLAFANTFAGDLILEAVDRYRVNLNAPGSAGTGDVTVSRRAADERSAMLVLNASDVFSPNATLTLNGRGGNNTPNTFAGFGYTRIDMQGFNATVKKLIIDSVEMPPGDYVSVGDNANLDNPLNWIRGTGKLTVTGAGAGGNPYAAWAAINAPTGNPNDDFDGDGVPNAVEFVLGGTKDSKDLAKLPQITRSGGDMAFTFVRDQASINPSVVVNIAIGTTLAAWPQRFSVGADNASSAAGVTVVKNSPVAGFDTITLTLTMAPDDAKFARLEVGITP